MIVKQTSASRTLSTSIATRMPTSAEQRAEQLRQPLREELVERVDVAEQAAHQVADRAACRRTTSGSACSCSNSRARSVGQHVLPGRADAPRLRALRQRADHVDAEQQRHGAQQAARRRAATMSWSMARLTSHGAGRLRRRALTSDEAERRDQRRARCGRSSPSSRRATAPRLAARCCSCCAITSMLPCHLMPRSSRAARRLELRAEDLVVERGSSASSSSCVPLRDDPAVVEHQDQVGVAHRA